MVKLYPLVFSFVEKTKEKWHMPHRSLEMNNVTVCFFFLPFFFFSLHCRCRRTYVQQPQATRTGMFVAVGTGLGVSYTLLRHGKALLQLFFSGNGSGKWGGALALACLLFLPRALDLITAPCCAAVRSALLVNANCP